MPTDSMCAFLAKPLVKSGWWLEVHHHFQRKFILQTCEIPTVQATWHEKHAFLDSPLTYFQSLNSYDPTDMVIKGSQGGWGSFPLEELPAKPLLTWHWSGTWEAILLLLKQDKTVLSINPHQFSQLLYTMNSSFTQVHVLAAQCIHEWTLRDSMCWVYFGTKPLRMADSWRSIIASKSEKGTLILQTLWHPTVHVNDLHEPCWISPDLPYLSTDMMIKGIQDGWGLFPSEEHHELPLPSKL